VQIVVHDSQVRQIEKTERVRLEKPQKFEEGKRRKYRSRLITDRNIGSNVKTETEIKIK
jgi:hypothetical protein